MRTCERNHSTNTRVSEEGEERDAPGPEPEISLQPMVNIMVRQLSPRSPLRSTAEQVSTSSPWRTPRQS